MAFCVLELHIIYFGLKKNFGSDQVEKGKQNEETRCLNSGSATD